MNNGAAVTFATCPTVTLNGNSGNRLTINVNPTTLVGVTTAFNVAGGDPSDNDKLVVNGSAANNVIGYNPTAINGGNVTITGSPTTTFTTIENVLIDGGGSAANDTLDGDNASRRRHDYPQSGCQ